MVGGPAFHTFGLRYVSFLPSRSIPQRPSHDMIVLGTLSVVEFFCEPATNLCRWECMRQMVCGLKTRQSSHVTWKTACQPDMCRFTLRVSSVRVAACGGAVQADPDQTGLSMCQHMQNAKETCCSHPHPHPCTQTCRCWCYAGKFVRSASYGCTIRAPSAGLFHCRTAKKFTAGSSLEREAWAPIGWVCSDPSSRWAST